ncbi:MAG: hypothetical protein U1G05_07370 [Kiritimatiellia bacterium]
MRVLGWRHASPARRPATATPPGKEDLFTRSYRRMMGPLIHSPLWRWIFLCGITLLLLGAMATVGTGWVKMKMLPFDNKRPSSR